MLRGLGNGSLGFLNSTKIPAVSKENMANCSVCVCVRVSLLHVQGFFLFFFLAAFVLIKEASQAPKERVRYNSAVT